MISDKWIDELFPAWFEKVQVTFSGRLPESEKERQQVYVVSYSLFKKTITQKLQEVERLARLDEQERTELHTYDDGTIAIRFFHETEQYMPQDIRIALLNQLTPTSHKGDSK